VRDKFGLPVNFVPAASQANGEQVTGAPEGAAEEAKDAAVTQPALDELDAELGLDDDEMTSLFSEAA